MRICVVLFFAAAFLSSGTFGLYFHVNKEMRCFLLEVPKETSFRVIYESPDTTAQKKILLSIHGPDNKKSAFREEHLEKKGKVSFTSFISGNHWICTRIDTSQFAAPDDLKMKFEMKIEVGSSSEDYADIAKKQNMNDLEVIIMKLRDRVQGIQKQQDYAKTKHEGFQTASESNNFRSMWFTIIQIGVLIISGIIQVRHLQSYFYKKKLV